MRAAVCATLHLPPPVAVRRSHGPRVPGRTLAAGGCGLRRFQGGWSADPSTGRLTGWSQTVVERHATGAPRTCCAIGTICRATEDTLLAFVDAVRRLLRYFNNVANGQRISDDDSAMVSSNVPNIAHPECEGLGSAQAVDNISEVCRLLQHACPPRPDPVGLSEAWRCAVIDAAKLADTVREVVQHYEGEQEDMAMGYRAFN